MKKSRQLKPIYELDRLAESERDHLWAALCEGLSYDRAVCILGKEHFAPIKRHRLVTWWHREDLRRQLNANLPERSRLAAAEFLQLLNGQTLPWSEMMHARILRAAFLLTEQAEDQTPSKLLSLQRIANNEFNQDMAREKLELEKRRQALREKQANKVASTRAGAGAGSATPITTPEDSAPAPNNGGTSSRESHFEFAQPASGCGGFLPERSGSERSQGAEEKSLTTDATHATNGHGCGESADDEEEEPFRLWTPAEIAEYQPMVKAALRAHPFLRRVVEAGDLSRLKKTEEAAEATTAAEGEGENGGGVSGGGEEGVTAT